MIKLALFILLLIELLSLYLLVRLLRSKRGWIEKVALSIMLLVPVVGPLIYLFLIEEVPRQHPLLRNTGARGDYTHRMISFQSDRDTLHILSEEDPEPPEETARRISNPPS